MSKYDYLKEEYPQTVSKEQLCKICGIAKDTAWIYLNSGVIPCQDTGKKTRRYSVYIDDVIAFLEKRDIGQVPTRSDLKFLRPKKLSEIRRTDVWKRHEMRYFQNILKDVADAVRPQEMADILGLSKTIIQQHVLHGNIEAVVVSRSYMISKESILAFMLSSTYQDGKGCSERYKAIMKELSYLEGELKRTRDAKREAKEVFDNHDDQAQLDAVIQHYLNKLKKSPEIMTVHDLKTLFDKSDRFILELLQKKKIRAVKVEGKYMIPQKSVKTFLEGASFCTMVQFHQHLWARMDR